MRSARFGGRSAVQLLDKGADAIRLIVSGGVGHREEQTWQYDGSRPSSNAQAVMLSDRDKRRRPMRSALCFVLLAPVLALAAAAVEPVTAMVSENGTPAVTTSPTPASQWPNIPPQALVGTQVRVGGTTYDWMANGPVYRMISNAPGWGVHVVWMYSAATTGQDFPDRNMRYNFYDFGTQAWNWIDSDYMQSGVNVFDKRAGYGNIDVDTAGNAIVGGHVVSGSNVVPRTAKDAAPGAGIFDYADGEPVLGVCQWPPIAVNPDDRIHIFPMTDAYDMRYSNIAPGNWPNFSTPLTGIVPSPGFCSHNIAASKVSSKITLVWEVSGNTPQDAYEMTSTDGGATWGNGPTLLDLPVAFGGDTVTSCYITSLFPWYDQQDRFHMVANFMPMINDTGRIIPAQIWHYCPDNTPQWSRIHVASVDPENFLYALTSNATLACRPSIGGDNDGNLYVAWEQFDTLNYDPTTSRARADIWVSGSDDNGLTWGDGLKITDAGTHSMRFPSIIDLAVDGGADCDTVLVVYEDDSVSGFYVAAGSLPSEGPPSPNPIVVHKIPGDSIPKGSGAVAEHRPVMPVSLEAVAWPNPFSRSTRLSYAVPHRGVVSLDIFDAAGRIVRTLASGQSEPGRFSVNWDGRSQSGASVSEGVYLYRYTLNNRSITGKLTLTR